MAVAIRFGMKLAAIRFVLQRQMKELISLAVGVFGRDVTAANVIANTKLSSKGSASIAGTANISTLAVTNSASVGTSLSVTSSGTFGGNCTANGLIANQDGNIKRNLQVGNQLKVTVNGTSSAPAIVIGSSSNTKKFSLWAGSGSFNIGVGTDKVLNFNGSKFFINKGVVESTGGNGVKIKSDGQVIYTTSSRRSKDNIQDIDITDMVDVLTDSRIVSFEYKSEPGISTVGMIAEELYEIDPRFVYAEGEVCHGINYEMLTLPLIAGWRQHQQEISDLKETISSLTERLEALEAAGGSSTSTRKRKTT